MNKKKIVVKVCQYYGGFALGCKLIDRVFPEVTIAADKLVKTLERKNQRDRARRRRPGGYVDYRSR